MAKKQGSARTRTPEKHLPTKPPKKTGKRGVGPLDEAKDFEEPVKKEPEGDQPELLETPVEKRPVVVKGRFVATILPPIYSSQPKSGDKLISLRISFALTEEHQGMFPKIVEEGWKWVKKPHRPKTSIDMPAQTVRFFLAHDVEEEELGLPIAKVTNTNLAVILKKGDGTALKVIRFQFRLQVPWSAQVSKFADSHYNTTMWLEMKSSQESLFDEGDED